MMLMLECPYTISGLVVKGPYKTVTEGILYVTGEKRFSFAVQLHDRGMTGISVYKLMHVNHC